MTLAHIMKVFHYSNEALGKNCSAEMQKKNISATRTLRFLVKYLLTSDARVISTDHYLL